MPRIEQIELDDGRRVTVRLSTAIKARYALVTQRADTMRDGVTDGTLLSLALVAAGQDLSPGHVVDWTDQRPFTMEAWLDEPLEVQAIVYAMALAFLFADPVTDAVRAAGVDPTAPPRPSSSPPAPTCATGSPS